jgi:hypothetical protein
MKDASLGDKVIRQLLDPVPGHPILLAPSSERAPPKVGDVVAECAECTTVCRHGFLLRQTIDLGGKTQKVEADQNQFAASNTTDRLVITVGKFSISDVFDQNKYAQNPRKDFMNWAVIDTGSYDYAADTWGYTYGAAAEWYQGPWTVRGGVFDISTVPNGTDLDPTFSQLQLDGELERRYTLWNSPDKEKMRAVWAYIEGVFGQLDQRHRESDPGPRHRQRRRAALDPTTSLVGPVSLAASIATSPTPMSKTRSNFSQTPHASCIRHRRGVSVIRHQECFLVAVENTCQTKSAVRGRSGAKQ